VKRLLIIGCGDVVRRALPQLLRRWRVYALVRQHDPALSALGVTQLRGDLDCRATFTRVAGLAHAVLHSAPPPDNGLLDARTRRLVAALRRRESLPRRLVYISTSGVYGDCGGAQVDETRTPAPTTARAQRRLDAERCLRRFGRQSSCRVAILRAPGIYAADRLPLERLRKGLPLLRAEEDVYTNHVHADDLAQMCIAALRCAPAQRIYNATDDSDLQAGAWFDKLADASGLPRAPRVTKTALAEMVSPLQFSFLAESRRLDNARLKRELLPQLRYPTVDAGIAAAVKQGLGVRG
jgi:nucleoside-diphosphate-sugar epimerase